MNPLTKYPTTIAGLIALVVFALLTLVLLAPTLHADPAQIVIIVGVLIVVLQQLVAARLAEGNGHRLSKAEQTATEAAAAATKVETRISAIEQVPIVNDALPNVPLASDPLADPPLTG